MSVGLKFKKRMELYEAQELKNCDATEPKTNLP